MYSVNPRQKALCTAAILGAVMLVSSLPIRVSAQSIAGKNFNPIMLLHDGTESRLAVVKWSAFGSGCRSLQEIPSKDRDVNFKVLPRNASSIGNLVFDLSFPKFSLHSGRQLEKGGAVELYSECAMRFAIRGQAGRRLKKIESTAKLDIQKEKGASLLIVNELRFGQFGDDAEKIDYDEQTEIKQATVELTLSKVLSTQRSDGQSSCGTDQVLFYDFTLFAKKTNKASQVSATLTPPKQAHIRLLYEDC
jgi:hypothetical protein